MEAITLPIEVQDKFSQELQLFQSNLSNSAVAGDELTASIGGMTFETGIAQEVVANFSSLFGEGFLGEGIDAFADLAVSISSFSLELSSIDTLISGFDSALSDLGISGGLALDNLSLGLQSIISGFAALSTFSLSGLFAGIPDVWSGLSSVWDSLFGRGGFFGGPSDDEMMDQAAGELATVFGEAFNDEVWSAFGSVITSLPRAESGGLDVLAAMWHPETVLEVLENIDVFSAEDQLQWVQNMEDHVRPVLQETLGLSDAETANLMGPLLQEILDNLAPGSGIHDELQRLLDWAESLGVEFDMPEGSEASESSSIEGSSSFLGGSSQSSSDYQSIEEENAVTRDHYSAQMEILKSIDASLQTTARNTARAQKVTFDVNGATIVSAILQNGGDVQLAQAIDNAKSYKSI